jgi:hypothetical protein
MDKNDFKDRLNSIIKEEIQHVLNERQYRHGGLLDDKDFDPVDPDIHVVGFGTMKRSALRDDIARRLEGALSTARDASAGGENSYDKFKALQGVLEKGGVLSNLIEAELEVADQLESLRTKGGRRSIPIPKQR